MMELRKNGRLLKSMPVLSEFDGRVQRCFREEHLGIISAAAICKSGRDKWKSM